MTDPVGEPWQQRYAGSLMNAFGPPRKRVPRPGTSFSASRFMLSKPTISAIRRSVSGCRSISR